VCVCVRACVHACEREGVFMFVGVCTCTCVFLYVCLRMHELHMQCPLSCNWQAGQQAHVPTEDHCRKVGQRGILWAFFTIEWKTGSKNRAGGVWGLCACSEHCLRLLPSTHLNWLPLNGRTTGTSVIVPVSPSSFEGAAKGVGQGGVAKTEIRMSLLCKHQNFCF